MSAVQQILLTSYGLSSSGSLLLLDTQTLFSEATSTDSIAYAGSSISILNNGTIVLQTSLDGNDFPTNQSGDQSYNWITSGIPGNYSVRATVVQGTFSSPESFGSAFGVWMPMTQSYSWATEISSASNLNQQSSVRYTIRLELALTSNTNVPLEVGDFVVMLDTRSYYRAFDFTP